MFVIVLKEWGFSPGLGFGLLSLNGQCPEGSPVVTLCLYSGLRRDTVLLLVMLCVVVCSSHIHLD